MSTDDDGGRFNFDPDELEQPGDPDSGDLGPEDGSDDAPGEAASSGARDEDAAETRGEDEHEVGGGHTGMGKGPTGS